MSFVCQRLDGTLLSCTPLMCVEVVALLPPLHQALLCSSGSCGVAAFQEVVAQGRTNSWIETHEKEKEDTNNVDDERVICVPINLSTNDQFIELHNTAAIVVVCHAYLKTNGTTLGDLCVHPTRKIRYVVDSSITTLAVHDSSDSDEEDDPIETDGEWEFGPEEIELSGFESITTLRVPFLFNCRCLKVMDLTPLRNVTNLGNNFMSGCESLVTIDLSPLSNVTWIGSFFLSECRSLTTIDFNPFKQLMSIGDMFLGFCTSLVTVVLSSLTGITHVGTCFMSGCANIVELDIGVAFSRVDRVQLGFMIRCKSLVSLTSTAGRSEAAPPAPTSHSGTIAALGSSFLVECTSLTTVDLSPMCNITRLEDSFLKGCSAIAVIDLTPLSKVRWIGHMFLDGCCSLTSVDLAPFSGITAVGHSFLSNCVALTSIDLRPLSNITRIWHDFMSGCKSLSIIDITPLENVTRFVDDRFLYKCSSLTSIDLAPFRNVTMVGPQFLGRCGSLTSVDLTPLGNVTSLGHSFLEECSSLQTQVDLQPLVNVNSLGHSFMVGCPNRVELQEYLGWPLDISSES